MKYLLSLVFIIFMFTGCSLRNGYHEVKYNNLLYKGNFVDDVKEGYGEMYYSRGITYKGIFKNNYPSGKGTVSSTKDNISYESEYWNKGKIYNKEAKIILEDRIIEVKAHGDILQALGLSQTKVLEHNSYDDGVITYKKDWTLQIKNKDYKIPNGTKYKGKIDSSLRPKGRGKMSTEDYIFSGNWPFDVKVAYTQKTKEMVLKNEIARLKKNKKCKIFNQSNENLIYIEGKCKDGFAHGKGKALEVTGYYGALYYNVLKGKFQNGKLVSGEYIFGQVGLETEKGKVPFSNFKTKSEKWLFKKNNKGLFRYLANGKTEYTAMNKLVFVGNYKNGAKHGKGQSFEWSQFKGNYINGSANGKGTCTYQGAQEPCEYNNGRRIDQVYLIRKERLALQREMQNQRNAIAQERRDQERQKIRDAKNAKEDAKKQRKEYCNKASLEWDCPRKYRIYTREGCPRECTKRNYSSNTSSFNALLSSMKTITNQAKAQNRSLYNENMKIATQGYAQQEAKKQRRYEQQQKAQSYQEEQRRQREYDRKMKEIDAKMAQMNQSKASASSSTSTSSSSKKMPEALAYCWETKSGKWICDGPIQKIQISEEDIDEALKSTGCPNPRSSTAYRDGKVFFCGKDLKDGDSSKMSWNRDIRGWYDIPY